MIQNNKILKEECDTLVLFTSESCNLRCSYCDMANHVNYTAHAPEAKKVKESLINGQYLNTLKTAFNRLEIDPTKILNIELWGQEPTLTLKEMCEFFPKLYELCPNINHIFFSTNGAGYIDSIINFVNMLNNTVNKKMRFGLQFSYDGKDATKNSRGANPEVIINNIIKYITELNKIELNEYLTLKVRFHNVIDNNIINTYADQTKKLELKQYLKEFSDLSDYFILLNNNKRVEVCPFSPGIINPYNATAEEGKNLYQFWMNCEQVGEKLVHKNWRGLAHQLFEKSLNTNEDEIMQLIYSLNNLSVPVDQNNLRRLSQELDCGFNTHALKIRYDGTLIHCQSAILGFDADVLKERDGHDYQIQRRRIIKGFYPNIITDSDEIIDKYLYECTLQNQFSFPAAFAQASNLFINLLYADQVDSKYFDRTEFLKCIYHLMFTTSCPHNSMMQTGTLYGKYAGNMRFLCNGFMDIIYQEKEKFIKDRENSNVN